MYDRYEDNTIAIVDIDIDDREQLDLLLKEFHTYLHIKLAKDEAEDDLSELFEFLKLKGIKVTSLDYDEIDI